MTESEMVVLVKKNLNLEDGERDLTVSDTVLMVRNYCNLPTDQLPAEMEPFIRKKVKGMIDYEDAKGAGFIQEVASIKEGDGSITFAQTDGNTRASIYGLSVSDKATLRQFRRLRGYA